MGTLAQARAREWEIPKRTISAPPELKAAGVDDHTVRMPTTNELAIAAEAMRNRDRWEALLLALRGGKKGEITKEARETLGLGDDIKPDTARKLTLLTLCSESPCEEEDAVWLANFHPEYFAQLTNAIFELVGQGSSAKKKQSNSTPKAT